MTGQGEEAMTLEAQNRAKCHCCDGCGQIADSDDGEPWTMWTSLPLNASAGVLLGLVKPLPCPKCNGSGRV